MAKGQSINKIFSKNMKLCQSKPNNFESFVSLHKATTMNVNFWRSLCVVASRSVIFNAAFRQQSLRQNCLMNLQDDNAKTELLQLAPLKLFIFEDHSKSRFSRPFVLKAAVLVGGPRKGPPRNFDRRRPCTAGHYSSPMIIWTYLC